MQSLLASSKVSNFYAIAFLSKIIIASRERYIRLYALTRRFSSPFGLNRDPTAFPSPLGSKFRDEEPTQSELNIGIL
jgi:hypothetical protein